VGDISASKPGFQVDPSGLGGLFPLLQRKPLFGDGFKRKGFFEAALHPFLLTVVYGIDALYD